MVPTRPSRAEASAGLSPAPWAAKTASTSGTSPSGVCWISLRNAHATGIFWRSGSWASSSERVPASAESLALDSRLWPSTGAISSRPSISPAWRAATDRLPAPTRPDDSERLAGPRTESASPMPAPQKRERDRGQRTADPREERQPGQAAREHDRAHRTADRWAHAAASGRTANEAAGSALTTTAPTMGS